MHIWLEYIVILQMNPFKLHTVMLYICIITNRGRDCMILPKSMEKKNNQQQIQLKLSTIFKEKVIDTPQTFGSFYDANGEKYCALSVLSKYLGYDIAAMS